MVREVAKSASVLRVGETLPGAPQPFTPLLMPVTQERWADQAGREPIFPWEAKVYVLR